MIAILVCLWFVVHLFRADARENPDASPALWVPLVWMFLAGSRYVSSWLSLGGPGSAGSYDEGSPIDRAVFFGLLIAGLIVLYRRRLPWGRLLADNKLLAFYLFFCLVSLLWSDEPFVGFKRWVKDLGNPVMALVILTEPRPLQALGLVLRRLAYLTLPLSVLFIRYYPELGRGYHADGAPMYTGIGHQKNALGNLCLVTGVYFAWQVLVDRENFRSWQRARRWRLWALVAMVAWLLRMADSQTSLATLLMVVGILWISRFGIIERSPTRLVGLLVFGALLLLALDSAFDLKREVFALLGRRPDLTNRIDLWAILFEVADSPLLGAGFMSFWTGERMQIIWTRLGTPVLQAHSGYIEQYLNLGYVGVAFIVLLLANGVFSARSLARSDPLFAHLRLCFVVAAATYNYTEAAFYGVSNMWVLLLCGLIVVSPARNKVAVGRFRARLNEPARTVAPGPARTWTP
ncbi:O-antigen ligase family protein [Rhizobacter fulvus]